MRRGVLGAIAAAVCSMSFGLAQVPVTAQSAFEKLKGLAGRWEGTAEDGSAVAASYRVTANRSAVVETILPGTEHEMVTMYHMDGDRLMLTHYCAVGNQPRMVLDPQEGSNALVFQFAGATNMKSDRDMHMHSARIRIVNSDLIEAEWDAWKDGKKSSTEKFILKRISR